MPDSVLKLAGRLLLNGLRFQYLKRSGLPGRPQAVSLEITHNCIAKCIMCNIWRIPRDVPDLPISSFLNLLCSDLLSDLRELDITGGEPFLRNDLAQFFSGICRLKRGNLKNLRSIAVTTNGFLTDRVLATCADVLPMLRDAGLGLVMVCAMDAVGPLHDRIRNYKNAWSQVNKTIQGLKGLQHEYDNLLIGLKTTVLPINVDEPEKITRYANQHGLFTIISPAIITSGRYLNTDRATELAFTPEHREKIIRFFQSDLFRWSYHAEALVRYLKTGIMKKPCTCGFNYFFVRSTGQLLLCPLMEESPGNISGASLERIFFSRKASRLRRKIGAFPQCRKCTEPGLERYALPYQGFTYLSIMAKQGRTAFLALHRHMGLDKYFTLSSEE